MNDKREGRDGMGDGGIGYPYPGEDSRCRSSPAKRRVQRRRRWGNAFLDDGFEWGGMDGGSQVELRTLEARKGWEGWLECGFQEIWMLAREEGDHSILITSKERNRDS